MDHSWCPVCDRHIFAFDNLYCSEACRRKDTTSSSSIFDNDSKEQYFEFPRCSGQKPFQSPYWSPDSSPMNSPLLHPMTMTLSKDFVSHDYHSKDNDLCTSPSNYLYKEVDLSTPRFTFGKLKSVKSSIKITSKKLLPTPLKSEWGKPIRKKSSFTKLFFF